jgi:FixJ family two-component response regulator
LTVSPLCEVENSLPGSPTFPKGQYRTRACLAHIEPFCMTSISTPGGITYVAVVDDDESQRRALGRLFRASGLQAITYDSAEAFLADAKRPVFDCLLLDIQLSGMSGIELRQKLLAAGDTTPVIYLTAHDDPEARARASALGCAAWFDKTASGEDVLLAILRAVSRA